MHYHRNGHCINISIPCTSGWIQIPSRRLKNLFIAFIPTRTVIYSFHAVYSVYINISLIRVINDNFYFFHYIHCFYIIIFTRETPYCYFTIRNIVFFSFALIPVPNYLPAMVFSVLLFLLYRTLRIPSIVNTMSFLLRSTISTLFNLYICFFTTIILRTTFRDSFLGVSIVHI